MLPIDTWFSAMTLESGLPPRPPRTTHSNGWARGLRRTVGRGLIALGSALAGPEGVGSRTVSVGH
jgi:hypothetical protein